MCVCVCAPLCNANESKMENDNREARSLTVRQGRKPQPSSGTSCLLLRSCAKAKRVVGVLVVLADMRSVEFIVLDLVIGGTDVKVLVHLVPEFMLCYFPFSR